MTRSASPRLGAYAGLAALGLLAALVLELPELAALAAPFAFVVAVGLALAREPVVSASLELERDRALEEEEVGATLVLESPTGVPQLEAFLRLPPGLTVAEGPNPVWVRLRPGERRELELRLRAERWGAHRVGAVALRARDRLDLFRHEALAGGDLVLRAYPRPQRVAELLAPAETQVYSGNHVSRERGEGIEFADLRPFAPGDRIRRVNWRASARRGELWVNEFHPERNADVVLFLDTFAEAGGGERSTLDMAVRAASELATRYLRQKDRVGLVAFGGRLNWLRPGTGLAQLYRIVDALLDAEVVLNYAWRDVDVIPRHILPPKALVLALSPLLDERAAGALVDLRGRGFDVAIVEISPVPFVAPGKGDVAALAHRIWRLRREAVRGRLEASGIPVGVWDGAGSLLLALEEVRAFRRSAALAHG